MGKQQTQLSHAEMWDDSALLNSWNDALTEYQLYHSIYARGERVEDVLKEVEIEADAQDNEMALENSGAVGAPETRSVNGDFVGDLEEGELGEEVEDRTPVTNHSIQVLPPTSHDVHESNKTERRSNVPAMPGIVLSNVKDEALQSLMMSWYYAGYYTGLYEGQQKASSTADQASGPGVNASG